MRARGPVRVNSGGPAAPKPSSALALKADLNERAAFGREVPTSDSSKTARYSIPSSARAKTGGIKAERLRGPQVDHQLVFGRQRSASVRIGTYRRIND